MQYIFHLKTSANFQSMVLNIPFSDYEKYLNNLKKKRRSKKVNVHSGSGEVDLNDTKCTQKKRNTKIFLIHNFLSIFILSHYDINPQNPI